MKKLIIKALTIAVFITSCVKINNPTTNTIIDQYTFTSQINPASRATDSNFESGDLIGITASYNDTFSDIYAQNVCYQYDGSRFTSSAPIEYTLNKESAFRAVYPYLNDADNNEFTFAINTDQTSYENYTLSDLMTAQTSLTTLNEPNLVFSHKLCLITLNITESNVSLVDATVTICAKNNVEVNLDNNTYIESGSAQDITMCENGTNSFRAIVAPQNIAAQTQFISINVGDEQYSFTLTNEIDLLSGKQYTYTGVITAKNELVITSTIDPWEDGGELNQDSSEENQEQNQDPDPDPETDNTQYNNWLGSWKLTSTSSISSGSAITIDIVIQQGEEYGKDFYIYGWDLSQKRWEFPLAATLNETDGKLVVTSINPIESTLYDELYYKAYSYVEAPYSTYYFISSEYTALQGTLSTNSSTATVTCGIGQITDGTSFTVATMKLCYSDKNILFEIDDTLLLNTNETLVGPFTMTKTSTSVELPQ